MQKTMKNPILVAIWMKDIKELWPNIEGSSEAIKTIVLLPGDLAVKEWEIQISKTKIAKHARKSGFPLLNLYSSPNSF